MYSIYISFQFKMIAYINDIMNKNLHAGINSNTVFFYVLGIRLA